MRLVQKLEDQQIKGRSPEQIAEMLLIITRHLPRGDSFCKKYYKVQSRLGQEFPKAYTDLPESVRNIICKKRKNTSRNI